MVLLVCGGTVNKYCGIECQLAYKWKNEDIPKVESGKCTSSSRLLKPYLIEKYGEYCFNCKQGPIWDKKPLVLQLDHIDGDSDNNFPSNIRLLCPNCHTQTPNFGSKGKGSRYKKETERNKYLRKYKIDRTLAQR